MPDADAAFELLPAQLGPGDVVLVKSSRDSGLRWLGERVAADAGPAPDTLDAVPGTSDAAPPAGAPPHDGDAP